MRRQSHQQNNSQTQSSDDECSVATTTTSSTAQILDRVQPDKVTVTKPEEDRRRRTIIVEKKQGSFGFTIQSYGIHYKKETEIEMITYVDYVDYDGPAYRAGMREGDVILSINGADMEKADHKTLVNYIKNCESRMRMVVLFEDCVRKVELHMRYIKLQNVLEAKMEELERLCIRERQLLEGKWKTHSLPARKKGASQNGDPPTPQGYYTFCRPTVSTEDVGKARQQQQQPPVVFAYQYLDNAYRYMLQPSTSSSGEYLLTFEPQRGRDPQNFVVKTPCDQSSVAQHSRSQQGSEKAKKGHNQCYSYGGHLCNPCMNVNTNNGDETSLDAYDLASPCCEPHCVPVRRRSRSHKQLKTTKSRESKTEETQTDPQPLRPRPHSQAGTRINPVPPTRRYFHIVSQCSLHSWGNSSEIAAGGESSATSYTTSLSTDTLYWDQQQQQQQNRVKKYHQNHEPIYVQYNQVKPKSWDNLTTKKKQNLKNTPHTQRRAYFQPTKSTESLLLSVPKYSAENLSDSSCECLETSQISPTDPNFGYYSVTRPSTESNNASQGAGSEATRL